MGHRFSSWLPFARAVVLLAVLAGLCAPGVARADYPDKPIKVSLPFGPGGVADVTMRLVAGKLSERLGQQFIIENRPGPGAISAAMPVKSAAADGYYLFLNGNGVAITAAQFKSLPYDVEKDFDPIAVMAQFDVLLVVKADGGLDSVGKLVETARARPNKLNFGSVAAGSTQNLAAEMFKIITGVDVAVVTFRTTPDLVTALMRGDVDVGFDYLAAFNASLADGKLKLIASGGAQRSPLTPSTPTVAESGWPDFVATSWNGVSAPAGTPRAIVDRLSREIREVVMLPEMQARSQQLGMEFVGSTPEVMAERQRADIERWRGVVTRLGMQR